MRWQPLAAALLVLAVFLPTLGYPFLLDDFLLFKDSSSLQSIASIPHAFTEDLAAHRTGTGHVQSSYYRPVFLALSTLYYQIAGPSPRAWHGASIVLAALVAGLATAFFGRLGLGPRVAMLAALVFALHPSHVGSIAWVSGLQEQLAAAFVLLSWIVLLSPWALRRPTPAIVLASLCTALGLLSKELALAQVPMTLAWLAFDRRDPARRQLLGRAVVAFSVVSAFYVAARVLVLGTIAKPYWEAPGLAQSVWSLPIVTLTYLRLLLLPFGFSFVRPERPSPGPLDPTTLVSLGGMVLLAACAWVALRRRRELALPCAWYGLWLAPVLNVWALFPEWMVTDRYLYLPSLALPWLLCLLVPRRAIAPTLCGIALVFTVLAARYAAIFADAETMTTVLLAVDPTSSWMHEERARQFLEKRKPAAAEAAFRRALELDPVDAYSLYWVGSFERDRGEFAAARRHFRLALVEQPDKSLPFTSLAYAMAIGGQRRQALALLRESVWRWPHDYEPRALRIALLALEGDTARVAAELAEAQRTWPTEPEIVGDLPSVGERLRARFRLG